MVPDPGPTWGAPAPFQRANMFQGVQAPGLSAGTQNAASQALGGLSGLAGAASTVAPQFALPLMILGGLLGAGQGGLGAFQASQQNRRQETAAQLQRQRIMQLIERLENPDTSGMDAAASRAFSQAADQIDASAASRGTFRAGNQGSARLQSDALASILASLAQAKGQQESQNAQLIGSLLQDPSFGMQGSNTNVGMNTFLGLLGGGFGGVGQQLGSLLNTEAGLEWLGNSGWMGGSSGGRNP